MMAIIAIFHAAWWFFLSWMASGGFVRIGFAVFERKPWRVYLAGEMEILAMPFRVPEILDELSIDGRVRA